MTTILLARHGESDWNRDRRWQGHADRPLTDLGREQARALADRLAATELDAVYSSDLERARETAAIVAEPHQLPVKELPDLREVDVGSWSGLTRAEAEERYPNAFRRWTEGEEGWDDGETYEQLSERVVGAVLTIATQHLAPGTTPGPHQDTTQRHVGVRKGGYQRVTRGERRVMPERDQEEYVAGRLR